MEFQKVYLRPLKIQDQFHDYERREQCCIAFKSIVYRKEEYCCLLIWTIVTDFIVKRCEYLIAERFLVSVFTILFQWVLSVF